MRVFLLVLAALLNACAAEKSPDAEADADADTDTDTDTDADADTRDTSPMDDTIELPDSPLPFTLTLAGGADGTATFDTIVCSHPPNNQFQLTYTDSSNAYTWNLRVLVRETFVGRGTYETNVQVQLLENFSGGRYYAADQTSGVSVTVDDFGVNGAYGSTRFDALSGSAGSATVTPQPVPFWCDAIED